MDPVVIAPTRETGPTNVKQVLQDLRSGETRTEEVPAPKAGRGQLLIQTSRSLISAGTERMLVEFGKASLLKKARGNPDAVRQVLDKIRTDGLLSTLEAVRHKLDQPVTLGYCNVGRVIEVGEGVTGFQVGDRVASNGKHAEVVAVPTNLCARIPDAVAEDHAAFTVLSAIALQGIRLAQPTLGETIAVTGLGLVGLITVQLLRSSGCRVLGFDFDPAKLALAEQAGAETVDLSEGEDPVAKAMAFSRGRGVDGVIITAATKSNEPVQQAAKMSRKRGRIVLVGVTGLELSRADFYEKELSFQVSCSYGPGRYDPNYEEKGQDYPVGYVRWTEQRNFEAVLDMMADCRLDPSTLISHRFSIDRVAEAYKLLSSDQSYLGILLEYPGATGNDAQPALTTQDRRISVPAPIESKNATPRLAFIGAGNYAVRTLIPQMKAAGAQLHLIASRSGVTGALAAKQFGFAGATADLEEVFSDPAVDAVVIATRHDLHASLAVRGLRAGKHVFVEKPLCLSLEELDEIERCYRELAEKGPAPYLMVGFNRRFAPQIRQMKSLLWRSSEPKAVVMTVNAGAIPKDHWTQDPTQGGGRIIGEACHFVDLSRFLIGAPCISESRTMLAEDTVSLQLRYADGSITTIHYFANGSRAFPKERIEVFCAGGILAIDNFRKMRGYGWHGFTKLNLWTPDKGAALMSQQFLESIRSGQAAPIPVEELFEVSRSTIALAK